MPRPGARSGLQVQERRLRVAPAEADGHCYAPGEPGDDGRGLHAQGPRPGQGQPEPALLGRGHDVQEPVQHATQGGQTKRANRQSNKTTKPNKTNLPNNTKVKEQTYLIDVALQTCKKRRGRPSWERAQPSVDKKVEKEWLLRCRTSSGKKRGGKRVLVLDGLLAQVVEDIKKKLNDQRAPGTRYYTRHAVLKFKPPGIRTWRRKTDMCHICINGRTK